MPCLLSFTSAAAWFLIDSPSLFSSASVTSNLSNETGGEVSSPPFSVVDWEGVREAAWSVRHLFPANQFDSRLSRTWGKIDRLKESKWFIFRRNVSVSVGPGGERDASESFGQVEQKFVVSERIQEGHLKGLVASALDSFGFQVRRDHNGRMERQYLDPEDADAPSDKMLVWNDIKGIVIPKTASNSQPVPWASNRIFWLYQLRALCGWACPGMALTGRLKDLEPYLRDEKAKAERAKKLTEKLEEGKEKKKGGEEEDETDESFLDKKWVLKDALAHQGRKKRFLNTSEVFEILDKPESLQVPSGPLSIEGHHYREDLEIDQILQEEIETEQIHGRAFHVRVYAVVVDYSSPLIFLHDAGMAVPLARARVDEGCRQTNLHMCEKIKGASVLPEEDSVLSTEQFLNQSALFTREESLEEVEAGKGRGNRKRRGGVRGLLGVIESTVVHSVLAVRDYYSRFFRAASGERSSSLHWHLWFFDFLIDKETGEAKVIDIHDNFHGFPPIFRSSPRKSAGSHPLFTDIWASTHFFMWRSLLQIFGLGPGKDPTGSSLRSRIMECSSDAAAAALHVPDVAVEYELKMKRSQGSTLRPVWPPDAVAATNWFRAFESSGLPESKFGAFTSALREAMTDDSGVFTGLVEWPEGNDREGLQKEVKGEASDSLQKWIQMKEEAGCLEELLNKTEWTGDAMKRPDIQAELEVSTQDHHVEVEHISSDRRHHYHQTTAGELAGRPSQTFEKRHLKPHEEL
uniref:Uncharacterized protein n=1 Tax=Chromera velia CCMP2878 TaxID=1169474 RepID=A0A0G4HW48_9ALVE|eukprot:Cvel_8983.t1-p1 / transcript=Cvel_8983.t1 / gene=Cvel_8983 / organism=Chromera_velia_CCMP2878 / gene_product=hypothetical protein / transcript_product=hypothetical protein / location=Cvel_scaffold507:11126-20279(-) / protein_length=745 / sequence_SO=supercontig / SO=protein_coding / is_pseudo=false